MPVTPTYPGVYIEEIPSGVRTITGVATSITAFVGRTRRGPDNTATVINSFGDFERIFGGLWLQSSLSYAVRDFYLNGGSQAIIVRLFHEETGDGAVSGTAQLTAGGLTLEAAQKGSWGANLRAVVDVNNTSEEVAARLGVAKEDLFNLTVQDTGPGGQSERFLNLTVVESPRRVDRVLAAESRLVRWAGDWPPEPLPDIGAIYDQAETLAAAQAADPPDPAAIAAAQAALDALTADPVTQQENALARARAALEAQRRAGGDTSAEEAAVQQALQDLDAARQAAQEAVSDGGDLTYADFLPENGLAEKKGLYALEQVDLFNLLCIPPYRATNGVPQQDVDVPLIAAAAAYCERRRAFLIVDPPSTWGDKSTARQQFTDTSQDNVGTRSRNAAIYFPRLRQANPLRDNQIETFAPCGAVAGVIARTDAQRGVWKAPAGLDASLVGVTALSVNLTDEENGELNPLGINCLRSLPAAGRVVWGARTLRGADALADEYKYIPVRRLALFIEESLYRGTQWAVFEPNDEPLWAQLRLNVGAFMHNLFRQGAFQGQTPREAYLVKCDRETTTQNDINLGIVNIVVGFAPLKPAEFVIIKIQQLAGQIET
ncbi:MAG: phage tail sheath subtilisin-like domain-containing protein [Chloroflexota bacterium]